MSLKRFPFFIGNRADMKVRYLESFSHTVSEAEELKLIKREHCISTVLFKFEIVLC